MINLQDKILLNLIRSEVFNSIIGDTPLNITQLSFSEENASISGRVSFNQPSVFKLRLEFEKQPDIICILKLKSEQIIRCGMELINFDNSSNFQKILEGPHNIIGYDNSHIRESRIYDNISESLKCYMPKIFGAFYDAESDIYAILMHEYKNDVAFDEKMLLKSLDAITDFHAYYYNRPETIDNLLLNHYTTDNYSEQKNILLGMLQRLEEDTASVFSEKHQKLLFDFAMHIDEYHAKLPEHKTLTHNDFTPRNIFCQNDGLIIYDWELACYQCPEHDLIEFLLFVMSELTDEQIILIVNAFKQMLFAKCKVSFTDEVYNEILAFNLLEYCVNRLSLYRVCNKALRVDFIDGLAKNAERLLTILNI